MGEDEEIWQNEGMKMKTTQERESKRHTLVTAGKSAGGNVLYILMAIRYNTIKSVSEIILGHTILLSGGDEWMAL